MNLKQFNIALCCAGGPEVNPLDDPKSEAVASVKTHRAAAVLPPPAVPINEIENIINNHVFSNTVIIIVAIILVI